MEETFKGLKQINFSGLASGEFQKPLGRLVWDCRFSCFHALHEFEMTESVSKIWITWIKLVLTYVQARPVSHMGPITLLRHNVQQQYLLSRGGIYACLLSSHHGVLLSNQSVCQWAATAQPSDSDWLLFICPAKKLIPQWSFHRKCVAFDPQLHQGRYGAEYQSLYFGLSSSLRDHLAQWWLRHSRRLPYVSQLWTEGSSFRTRQKGEGYLGLSLANLSWVVCFFFKVLSQPPVTGENCWWLQSPTLTIDPVCLHEIAFEVLSRQELVQHFPNPAMALG